MMAQEDPADTEGVILNENIEFPATSPQPNIDFYEEGSRLIVSGEEQLAYIL